MRQLLETMLKLEEKEFEDIFQPFTDKEIKDRGLEFAKKVSIFQQKMEQDNPKAIWIIGPSAQLDRMIAWSQNMGTNRIYIDHTADVARRVGLKEVKVVFDSSAGDWFLRWKDESK